MKITQCLVTLFHFGIITSLSVGSFTVFVRYNGGRLFIRFLYPFMLSFIWILMCCSTRGMSRNAYVWDGEPFQGCMPEAGGKIYWYALVLCAYIF
jgi:hypothetical protein